MDEASNEHSDSDSGESWTILEHNTTEDGLKDLPKNENEKMIGAIDEKDDDTDGISIISDSETDSPLFLIDPICNSLIEEHLVNDETPLCNVEKSESTSNILKESFDDFEVSGGENIGDNNKHRTYVHRRNNRLSTVLNIMMLVSVMTAAGVAIGHMWGAKNDCSSQTPPTYNKILSDLYKLQEENANYRNKLMELSLIIENNFKIECEREVDMSLNDKQQTSKCRKQKLEKYQKYLLTSDSIDGRKGNRAFTNLHEPQNNSQFLARHKRDSEPKLFKSTQKVRKLMTVNEQKNDENLVLGEHNIINTLDPNQKKGKTTEDKNIPERKISYADSLKINKLININIDKNYFNIETPKSKSKKKARDINDFIEESESEEDYMKTSRHFSPKHTLQRKKYDRHKSHKFKGKKNKHIDWDLKEGLLKYYDDLSKKLSDSSEFVKSKISVENGKKHDRVKDNIDNDGKKQNPTYKDKENRKLRERQQDNEAQTDVNWFDNRAKFRKEARKKLEHEMFGSAASNTGEWYFRRMHKREQCRVKENSTAKKISIKNKNFKVRL